jgi:hypothetical protein
MAKITTVVANSRQGLLVNPVPLLTLLPRNPHCLIQTLKALMYLLYRLVIAVEVTVRIKQVFLHKARFLPLLSAVPLPQSLVGAVTLLAAILLNAVSRGRGHALLMMDLSLVMGSPHLLLLVSLVL